ncbi:MAG: M15 family metallopeptidase [Phycisphaeraceae bacterium]
MPQPPTPPPTPPPLAPAPLELTGRDRAWWLEMEERVIASLVDLEPLGFIIAPLPYERGWTQDATCRLRAGVAAALVRARDHLPTGCNFKILDAHRPWALQQLYAERSEQRIREAHPDWSDAEVTAHLWRMAPPARVVPRLGSHRYGGAVDVAVVDDAGKELDMGVPAGYVAGPESYLLHYELNEPPAAADASAWAARENRRVLMRAMQAGGFDPYLPEWWHWSCQRDVV